MSDLFDFERPKKYAVMGNPVAHSLSPRIHQLFAAQFGIRLEYSAIQVDPGGFAQAVDQFRANGGQGLNVTVPYKLEAFRLAQRLSERAQFAGAVNTLKFGTNEIFGDNTDGAGLVRDLSENLHCALGGRRVLVVGAGGAVRGVLGPLRATRPATLVIANRTVDKAHELAALFYDDAQVHGCGLAQLTGEDFDIVINGTSSSLHDEVPALPPGLFAGGALAYDMMYRAQPTAFMQWAQAQGATRVVDGIGMLVEQAAESFLLWHGKRPETLSVINSLRA